MSLLRYLGLGLVGIWLVLALCFSVMDVCVLADPSARRAEHICVDDRYGRLPSLYELSDRECVPRLAVRAGLDALVVALPMAVGVVLLRRCSR